MNEGPKPFDCTYSPHFAELLCKLQISLAISTYQAGKIVILSGYNKDKLVQLTRNFENAMGMAVSKNRLAVSAASEVVVLNNKADLAESYPNKPKVYDGIFIPAIRYNTGYLALHDMEFINNKITAVNTLFSCLCYIDGDYSFTPFWQPPFISEIVPEDRCHLNGIAVENNKIKYLTALGNTNSAQGWRDKKMDGGIIMEYPSGRIISDGLAMPHSPRIYNGKLYLLNSAQGELICVNPQNGCYETIANLGGFARGMACYGDYLFIGVSKLRHNSEAFKDLPIAKTSFAGVVAVYLPYKTIIGDFRYEMSVDEIYDVKVIENATRPSIISPDMPIHGHAISIPSGSFWSQPSTKDENTNKKPNTVSQVKYQVLENSETISLITQYKNLVYPLFVKKANAGIVTGDLLGLVALIDGKTIGLCISELKPDNTAELHSICVMNELQKKGIGSNLLNSNDKELFKRNITHIDATWNDIAVHAKQIEKLLIKLNWLQPKRTVTNVKLNVKEAFKASWKESVETKTDAETEVINWESITEKQKQEIHSLISKGIVQPHLTPFQLMDLTDNKISKAIIHRKRIIGWCIVHKVKPDTIQGSSLFIIKEYRNIYRVMKLLYGVFLEAKNKNIPYFNYQTSYTDSKLNRLLNGLTLKQAIVKKYTSLASRKYYN